MKRVAAVLFLMAAVCGCATAPAPIEVTYVTRAPHDRSTEIAGFWRDQRRATPVIASVFSKPDAAAVYREKWRKELADQAWRDAVWRSGKTHAYFR